MSEISEVGLLEFVGVALIRNVFQENGRKIQKKNLQNFFDL